MATPTIHPEFQALISCLNTHEVRYLVIGGIAVVVHGYVRTTKDLDLWVDPSDANAQTAADALNDFIGLGIDAEALAEPSRFVRFGRPPTQVDVLNVVPGVDSFQSAFADALHIALDGVDLPVISLRDLRAAKRAAGRPQDLADLHHLPDPDVDPPTGGAAT
jgi:hypothetical protein